MESIVEPRSETDRREIQQPGPIALGFYLLAGVVLPVITLAFEAATRLCAENLFDPIPTWWHALLVAFVPATHLQTWLAFYRGSTSRPGWLSFANGVAIFVSLYYTVVFAPVAPIAVLAIVYFLLGLLPLAPLFSLIAGLLMRRKLSVMFPRSGSPWFQWKALAGAFGFVLVTFSLVELSFTITRIGIARANSADAITRDEGVSFLRKYGDPDYVLRLSYDGSAAISSDFLMRFFYEAPEHTTTAKQARNAYYLLTGRDYRQAPVPRSVRHWERWDALDGFDQSGSFRINKGLSLSASQMDGSVDADAALAYLEWTLLFKNESLGMQEAISQIQLPPDAVVSRLTLWINGEEREAAFARSAKVIEAYDQVTSQRRDPALVTVTGKDRVQLKCFPVPAQGEMKVRLGITVPIALENTSTGYLAMPYFQHRNFAVHSDHSIWIESKNNIEIANPAFKSERSSNVFGVRGRVSDSNLANFGSPVRINRAPEFTAAWAKDTLNEGYFVKQELTEIARSRVDRIIFVVDPSIALAESKDQIAGAVRSLPADAVVGLVLSGGNGLNSNAATPNSFEGSPETIAGVVDRTTFDGGVDAVPAIETAWEIAHSDKGGAIVWIHGPQPVEFESAMRLTQLWTRRPAAVQLFSLQIGNGVNAVERTLNESDAVSTLLRTGSLHDDLTRVLGGLINGRVSIQAVRTMEKALPPSSRAGKQSSQHLVRLWANDETLRLLRSGDETKAIETSVKNQLVTRVSGAVVLENQEQYDQFGLKPVDANAVPTIPEPEDYLLFAVVLLVLIFFVRRAGKLRLRSV